MGFGLDLVNLLEPKGALKPFINIGLRVIDIDVSGPSTQESDSDLGFAIGAGLEVEIGKKLLGGISLEHDNVGDDANFFSAFIGDWLTDKTLIRLDLTRDIDSDTTAVTGGVAYNF